MKTIDVVVSPTGQVRVQTHGFTGASCRAASQSLEQLLGTMTEEQLTPEYFISTAAQQHQQQRSGPA